MVALTAAALWSRPAAAVKIRIKGSAQIEAVATAEQEGFTVRGELTDDVGVPIPSSVVVISALSADGGKQPVPLPPPLSCDPEGRGKPSVTRPNAHEYSVDTDERGTFCVRAATPLSGTLRLRYAGTKLHEPVEARVTIDTGTERLARTVLRFEPAPEVIDLDRESVAITGSLRIDRSESSRLLQNAPTRREGLLVVLEDERGERIAEAQTGGDGRVRFEVKTARLGAPGPGELRLRFDASGALAKATATQAVVRRAVVSMSVPHPAQGNDPEDGIPIEVEVGSSRGAVTDGVVEALRNGDSVGAGRVENGKATVVVAFPAERSGSVPLALRYVPSAPWWRSGAMLEVTVRVAGPGIAKHLVLAVLVAGFAAWIVAGWRRAPKKILSADLETATAPPSGRPGVLVLGASAGQSGWRGHVADAHDGTPIAGARLRIVVPSFEGEGVIAEATSDERGTFALEAAHRSDARLIVDSPDHSAYEQALPQPSVLGVALITRRRALLDRLVRWARRTGAPYDGPPEPTPGHVRRAAGRAEASEVEAWARRVEDAAFGPTEVDGALEDEVRAAEPRGG
jgi:hypothetical protein